MVTHTRTTPLDPAADAAALLRRLGFSILFVLLPLASFLSRRSTVVLAPVGVSLIAVSSIIEAPPRGVGRAARAWITRPAGVTGLLLLIWAALTGLWAPDQGEAFDKLFNLLQAVVLAMLGVSLLPERVRASNLYLISIGATVSALLALVLLVARPRGILVGEIGTFERGLAGLAILIWPAAAWLESRSRRGLAVALVAVTAAALVGARLWMPLTGFVTGVVFYAFAVWRPIVANRFIAWVGAGILLGAPLIATLLLPLAKLLLAEGHILRGWLSAWGSLVLIDPVSFLIGHGLDTLLPARLLGTIPADTPRGLPFELWFELGALGAILASLTFYFTVRSFEGLGRGPAGSGRLVPGLMALLACAFMLSYLGAGAAFPWWVTTLAVNVIAFWAIAHGQFRTNRPKARWPSALPGGTRRARAASVSEPPAAPPRPVSPAAADTPSTGKSFVRMKVPTRPDERNDRDAPLRK